MEQCINSILDQKHHHLEIIIVDDGSTDKTKNLVEKIILQNPDKKIFYFYQENQWIWAARNKGIELAHWDFLTFLDSDDIFLDNHLALRVAFLEKYPQVEFLYGSMLVNGSPEVWDAQHPGRMIHYTETSQWSTLFGRKEAFEKVGVYKKIRFWEDADYLERVKNVCLVQFFPEETYVYNRTLGDELTKQF